jgi:hypothetical protein
MVQFFTTSQQLLTYHNISIDHIKTLTMAQSHSTILELPFEIRAKIWQYVKPTPVTVQFCFCYNKEGLPCQRSSSTRKDSRRCIKPFLAIVKNLDPLQVVCHDPKLLAPGHTFVFCSAPCLRLAMRLAIPIQRAYFNSAKVRINFSVRDLAWIHSSPDSENPPANLGIEHSIKPSFRDFEVLGDEEDVEGGFGGCSMGWGGGWRGG